MILLAIDTSFDDTAVAVTQKTTILSNVLSTELSVHEQFGGIVPNLARDNHKKNIDAVIRLAMKRAQVTWDSIDAIAVTLGPGLAIALEVGIAKAKELSITNNKPLVTVNHMEGHLLSFLAQRKEEGAQTTPEFASLFPLLAVLVSGGHTQFVLAKNIGNYEIIGETQDDAIGECFDKVGRMLGLGYPAGKLVETMAKEGTAKNVVFPVPMRQVKDANTSFSGLKTAAMRIVEKIKQENGGNLSKQNIADISYGFQTACITHVREKLQFALKQVSESTLITSIVVGGGVTANMSLRRTLRGVANDHNLPIYFPYSKKLCVDNAAMIGIAGYFKAKKSAYTDLDQLDRRPVFRIGDTYGK